MMMLLELLISFIFILFIWGIIILTRKMIPEFDTWWKKVNTHDSVADKLEFLKREETQAIKNKRLARGLNKKQYEVRLKFINQIIKERKVR